MGHQRHLLALNGERVQRRLAIALATLLCIAACDGGIDGMEEDETNNAATAEIGVQGGKLTSKDGRLTLDVPAGALGNVETISIREIATAELGSEFDELVESFGVDQAYELGPDGLAFGEPVTVRFVSEQVPIQRRDSLGLSGEFLFTSDEGALEALDSLRTSVDTTSAAVVISGRTTHFTPLVPVKINNGVQFFVNNVPEMLEVGESFDADVVVADADTGPLGEKVTVAGPARYRDRSSAPISATFEGAPSTEIPAVPDLPGSFQGAFGYTCTDVGLGVYGSEPSVRVRFDLDSGPITAESFANFVTTIDCVEKVPDPVTLTVVVEGEGTVTSDPAGINCPNDCEEAFAEGTAVTLTAEPGDGWKLVEWRGEAPDDCGDTRTCSFAVSDARNDITAVFSAEDETAAVIENFGADVTGQYSIGFELTVTYDLDPSDLNATIDPDDGSGPQDVRLEETDGENEFEGSLDYEYGEDAMFPAMPSARVVNPESGEGDSRELIIETVTLTLQKSGDGDGTVTGWTDVFGPVGIFTCGPGCTEESAISVRTVRPSGEVVEWLPFLLDAYPDDVSVFAGWSGDIAGGEGCDDYDAFDGGRCLFEMNRDRTVTATFLHESTAELAVGMFLLTVDLGQLEAVAYVAGAIQGWGYGIEKNYQDEVEFGDLSGTFINAFSGAEGFVVVDLLTEEVLLDGTGIADAGPYFGVIGLSEEPPGPQSPATFFAFGQNGYGFFDTSGEGSTTPGTTTFDAFPASGDPLSGWATVVQPDEGVRFVAFDAGEGSHRFTEETIPADAFDDQLVSAFLPDDGSPADNPLLVLDRAVESGLYLAGRDGSTPTRVANVGLDARKIRCLDAGAGTFVCGITVFGDDAVAIVTWDGRGTPAVTGTVPAGDGPVDLGLIPLENGNVGLVTTGFNDETVTEVEIAPGGNVVNSSTRPVLDGCRSPGHALYVRDEAGLKVVGTCYDSDNYFVMESDL